MNALIAMSHDNLEYGETGEPKLQPGHVLIRVAGCGICGTDMHVYKGMASTWPTPGIRGHEFAGTVRAIAEDVEGFSPGDRVVVQPLLFCGVCRSCLAGRRNLCSDINLIGGEQPGGFAEYAVVPAANLFRIPDSLPLAHAALVEPLATAVHALERNWSSEMESMVIFGAGAQGLMLLQVALFLGIKKVAVTDVVESRLELAMELGATRVINPAIEDTLPAVLEMNGGAEVDLTVDAAGITSTRQQALSCLRPGGTAIFLALGAAPTPVDFMGVVGKELKLTGTQCYTERDFAKAIQYLAHGCVSADKLISEVPLSEGAQAFRRLAGDPGRMIKAVLVP